MSITTGTRLGPYEIVASIGAGGMGEVYRARDTRLGRDVALKVLPSSAADADRLRRFEQEARATAALNHPNLLAVFDIGADLGVNYMVSELLEGETVRDRLRSGPLPARKAAEYGSQIARGLAAAHDKAIVHRDLKPENLFITRDGRVKILDFGIAKLAGPDAGGQTLAATVEAGTTPGTLLGTIGYMSPEQVRGLGVDHRTDIFSLGAILYEMASGRRAFAGATQADTMSAILNADPVDLSEPGREMPPALDRLIRRCLEKTPEERFQSARDLAFDLETVFTGSHSGTSVGVEAPPVTRTRPSRAWVPAALAVGVLLGGAGTWVALSRGRGNSAPANIHQLSFRRGTMSAARFSPDGETIVYSAAWEGRPQELYTTRVGAVGERPLGITGELLAISKTGELALLKDVRILSNWMQVGTLARAPLAGGAPREILRDVGGADWSPDGRSLAITRLMRDARRWQLEYPVGTVVYTTDRWIEQPRISRDEKNFLLLEHPPSGDNRGRVIMVTRDGKKTEPTPEYASVIGLAWTPAGDEAWFSASTSGVRLQLLAARANAPIREIMPGPASLVVEDVLAAGGRMLVQTISTKVRMLVKTPSDEKERDISWFDYGLLRDMAPDGSMILFEEEGEGGGPNYSVFIRRTDGSPAVRLGDGYAGRFSPDLQWATTSSPLERGNVLTIVPVGPGEPRKVTIPIEPFGVTNWRWFPDGKRLIVMGNEPGRPRRTYEYVIDTGKVRPLTPDGTTGTLLSPDGRSLAVTAPDGKQLIWPLEGGEPRDIPGVTPQDVVVRWAADGRSIFVVTPSSPTTRTISRIDVANGRRQVVTTIAPADGAGVRNTSLPLISADGRTYAYRYSQILSDLFVANGMR